MIDPKEVIPIPDIPIDLQAPVNSLLNVARLYQNIIARAFEREESMRDILTKHIDRETIDYASAIMVSWNAKLPDEEREEP